MEPNKLRNFVVGQVNISPGQMLRLWRELNGVSCDDVARLMRVSSDDLDAIEQDMRPFPMLPMCMIFIHGLSGWYASMTDDKI